MRGHVIEEGLPPADPVEIAAAFTALGRSMALMSKAGETSRAGNRDFSESADRIGGGYGFLA